MTQESLSVTEWIDQLRAGDSNAAAEIWKRYFQRLVEFVRRKYCDSPSRVADEEDAALDAFDSLYNGLMAGKYPNLSDRDDLWRMLIRITENKFLNQIRDASRQKRGGGRERGHSVFDGLSHDGFNQIPGHPIAEYFDSLSNYIPIEVGELLNLLPSDEWKLLCVCKLKGMTNEEISTEMSISVATVERRLAGIRRIWTSEND
ncbi:RNA polymerase sigma factor RpoE [Thalassoglobus neptunius]|uniref:RNA polymerase sigma factor RpoE n=1 Tax=Thalassoglobus neptunius TaxID=1938619 RepID=A0A5C5VAL1_9PLAN|nr:ECF-type sigma factor [Thalassoglobus neptunius]TWT35030.1 RNA polymerase sigma factor RpoE [Thalassoglobus neptunius]